MAFSLGNPASALTSPTRLWPARRTCVLTRTLWIAWGLCVFCMPTPTCRASDLRYQLGKRVQRFEAAWEEKDSPEARARVLAPLQAAVSAFFSGNQAGAGKSIDQACLALDEGAASPEQQLWHSLNVSLASPLVPLGTPQVELRIDRGYKLTETPEPSGMVQVALLQGERVCFEGETQWTHLAQTYAVPTAELPAGD